MFRVRVALVPPPKLALTVGFDVDVTLYPLPGFVIYILVIAFVLVLISAIASAISPSGFVSKVNVLLLKEPPVVESAPPSASTNSKCVASVTTPTWAPEGIPSPLTPCPVAILSLLAWVIVGSLL